MAMGNTTRTDINSAVATNIIRGNLERLAHEVKVLDTRLGKVIILGDFRDGEGRVTTLRYLVNGNSVTGPNPDRFGAKTKADIAVSQIEEDLYANDADRDSTGKRYVTYRL